MERPNPSAIEGEDDSSVPTPDLQHGRVYWIIFSIPSLVLFCFIVAVVLPPALSSAAIVAVALGGILTAIKRR